MDYYRDDLVDMHWLE